MKRQVMELARQFIAGRDVRRSIRRLGKLHDEGLRFSIDLLVGHRIGTGVPYFAEASGGRWGAEVNQWTG